MTRKIIYIDRERGLTDVDGTPLNLDQLESLSRFVGHSIARLQQPRCVWRSGCTNPEKCKENTFCGAYGDSSAAETSEQGESDAR